MVQTNWKISQIVYKPVRALKFPGICSSLKGPQVTGMYMPTVFYRLYLVVVASWLTAISCLRFSTDKPSYTNAL